MTQPHVISSVTCLGCGCTCDDIEVTLDPSGHIATRHTCALGVAWFGAAASASRVLVDGHDASLDEALARAATLLAAATNPRVVLGRNVACETYREAIACADLLHARLDATSPSAMSSVLAIQERGIATATLGEIRNRADVILFWGIDPSVEFPRYESRYAPDPAGTHVPDGRTSRTVIALDIGDARGPSSADTRITVAPSAEIDLLITLAALLEHGPGSNHAERTAHGSPAAVIAGHLRRAHYAAVVVDLRSTSSAGNDRIHRLLALGHALNVSGRGALSLLRDGGNQCGAEAVTTRQTGYPSAVDFASGVPRYRPHAPTFLASYDTVLLVGSAWPAMGPEILGAATIAIGPRASDSAAPGTLVAIDTATAGIHAGGTAVRMDDVPLPLTRLIAGPPDAALICQSLRTHLQRELA